MFIAYNESYLRRVQHGHLVCEAMGKLITFKLRTFPTTDINLPGRSSYLCFMFSLNYVVLQGKTSTKDLLEKISSQLGDIENFNRDTQAWYKKLIGYLLAYFAVLYFLAIIIVYYNYYYDPEWQDFRSRLRLLTPFLVAPLM